MSEISGMNDDALKEALHGRIFYNRYKRNMKYLSDGFTGNVVEKAERYRTTLKQSQ